VLHSFSLVIGDSTLCLFKQKVIVIAIDSDEKLPSRDSLIEFRSKLFFRLTSPAGE
jgi:hypothetical protein